MPNGTNKAPKGWLIAGIVCLLLGLAGCGAAAAGGASLASVVDDIADTRRFGDTFSFTSANDGGALILLTADAPCDAISGSGDIIAIEDLAQDQTLETEGRSFSQWRTFDTVDGERYEVTCGAEGSGDEFTVVKFPELFGGLLSGPAGILAVAIAFLGGGLFLLLGVIFLIVGLVKRSKWKKRQQGTPYGGPGPSGFAAPPPGSGAPGYGPGPTGASPPPPMPPGPQGPPPGPQGPPPGPQGPPPMPPGPQGPPPAPGQGPGTPPPPPGPSQTPPPFPPPPAPPGQG